MVRSLLCFSLMILILGCQEDEMTETTTVPEVILPTELGTKILSFSDHYSQRKFVWSADNQVFFISDSRGIFKYDYAIRKNTLIVEGSVSMFDMSADKSEILFDGSAGVYSYKVTDNEIALLEAHNEKSIFAAKYKNHVFIDKRTIIRYTEGCISLTGSCYREVAHEFSHVDMETDIVTPLRGRMSENLFSADGSRLLILDDLNYWYYILDTRTMLPTDSFKTRYMDSRPRFFFDEKLRSLEILSGDVIIWDRLADVKMDSIETSTTYIDGFTWSYHGDKLYYAGKCKNSNCSVAIWCYDLHSKEEKIVLSLPSTFIDPRSTQPFGGSPFHYLATSADDKKIVFEYMGELFVKEF